jgi:hypothetical protein
MISDRDLDRLISSWLAEPTLQRAPDRYVAGALAQIATTTQRRPLAAGLLAPLRDRPIGQRLAIALMTLVLLGVAIALAVGAVNELNYTVAPLPTARPTAVPTFHTAEPSEPTSGPTQKVADVEGWFEISLPETFHLASASPREILATYGDAKLSVRVGDATGSFVTCLGAAGPWEECAVRTATTLGELEAAMAVELVLDHGIGPPVVTTESATLDGEAATVVLVNAYEYPANGGQWLGYILAVHDGRPYVVRAWNREHDRLGLTEVLSGFRFLR